MGEGVEEYSRALLAVGVLLLVAALGWAGFHYWREGQEKAALLALYESQSPLLKKKAEFARAELPQTPEKDKEQANLTKENLVHASGDLQTDYGPELKRLKAVIDKFPTSKAAVLAALDLADLYASHKDPSRAIEVLARVEKALARRELLYGIWTMKLANLRAEAGDCPGAIEGWQKILAGDEHRYLHPEANLRLGVCYENMKDLAKAKEMYQQTFEKFPESSAGMTAQKYLLYVESKNQSEGKNQNAAGGAGPG